MTKKDVERLVVRLSKEYNIDDKTVLKYFYKIGKPGIHLIEWPTGSGKSLLISILALLYPLTSNLKSFIFCRTYAQMDEYLKRLNDIATILEVSPRISMIVGKETACPYGDIYNKEASYIFCNYLGNGSRCRDYKNIFHNDLSLISSNISNARSTEEAIEYLIEKGLCPYYSLRQIGEFSDICISSYYYLFRGPLSGMGEPLRYCIFIDEGHNLIDYYIDTNVVTLDRENLHKLSEKLNLEGETHFLSQISKERSNVKKLGKKATVSFLKELRRRLFKYYYELLQEGKAASPELFNQSDNETINKLFNLNLDRVFDVVYKDDAVQLYVMPKFTSVKNILNSSYSVVIASATLSPLKFFSIFFRSLGISKEIKKYDKPYLYDFEISAKLNVYINNKVTSRYMDRTPESFYLISDFAIKITKKNGYSTILFVPSAETGEILYSIIRETLLSQNEDSLEVIIGVDQEDIESFIKGDKLSILILTQRGKYSEGVNYFRVSDKPYNIIMYGLSVQPTDPLKEKAFSKLFKLSQKEMFLYGYILPAVIFFVQSIGRVLKKKREVNLFIFERRFLKYFKDDITPKWFRKLIENHEILSIE